MCFKSKKNCYFKKMIKSWNPLIYFSIRRLCSGIFSKLLFFFFKRKSQSTEQTICFFFKLTSSIILYWILENSYYSMCVYFRGGKPSKIIYKVLKKIKMEPGSSKVIESYSYDPNLQKRFGSPCHSPPPPTTLWEAPPPPSSQMGGETLSKASPDLHLALVFLRVPALIT